jgi:NAD(P)-dependent dehydrogenase (short-subunit alcohol dehydrogenase family)
MGRDLMMSAPIVVMGAHGGIGEQLAEQLVSDHCVVYATARDKDALNPISEKLGINTAAVDVFDEDSIEAAINDADEGEGIRGLAYCVGSIDLKPFKATQDGDFLNSYELNVLGAIRALRRAENGLKKAKGSVVLFSTIAVQQGFTNHTLISTAKGAIEGLTKSLAAEWAPDVRVNCIAPSLSDTPLAAPITSSEQIVQSIASMHAIPRLGTAEDSASLAAFLLGDQSSWITGQIFHVDGGRSTVRVKG